MNILEGKHLRLSYTKTPIIRNASVEIAKGEIVSIIGPNGSGKSTLLKGLCRLKRLDSGQTLLEGKDIWKIPTREVAREMAILPQMKNVMGDITVRELIGFGRFPHRRFAGAMSREDEEIVEEAIGAAKLESYRDRLVCSLSGGEQQRAWIAMALAQQPRVLILDEPTTFLDISHQLEIMETIRRLNQEKNMTIVMVLHDVNQAVRFSDKICAVKDGEVIACENSDRIITRERIRGLFGIDGSIYRDIDNDCPFFIPTRSVCGESC